MESDRLEKGMIAMYDHLTRTGTTAASAKEALKQEGYTAAEIAQIANYMLYGASALEKK